jgi:DHA3 family macrolide efflux protein-like MFS transporter
VPLLVPPGGLGRANGLMQLGPAVGIVVGPLLAAPLVAWWGLTVVLVVDLVTFAVAVATVAAVRLAEPGRPVATTRADVAWRPVLEWLGGPGRPLRTLLFTGAAVNAVLALFNLGLLALATEIAGPARAGLPIAAIGVALVAGSLLAGARGVGDDRIGTFTLGLSTTAAGCVVAASGPHLALVIVGGVLAVVLIPAVNAATATVFQEHVPAHMQGRVFGLRGAISGALYPVSAALGGLLIDRIGAPLMDGPLAGSLGRLIGAGPERGAALVVLAGGVALAGLGAFLAHSPIRAALHAGAARPSHGAGQHDPSDHDDRDHEPSDSASVPEFV